MRDERVGRGPLGLGVEGRDDAVAEDGAGHGMEVGDAGVEPAVQRGAGLGGQDQGLAGPRPGPPGHGLPDQRRGFRLGRARGPDQVAGVDEDVLGHGHPPHQPLEPGDLLGGERGGRLRSLVAGRPPEDLELLGGARIVHPDVEHEPVELGLGERIGPLLLDRILGRQDEERVGQGIGSAPGRHVPLLHGLQERGLGLRGRAIDLVGQDDVGEDRPGDEREVASARLRVVLEDVGARDVRGHQVGRELDPAEREPEDLRQGADQEGLGQPRHADQAAHGRGRRAR